MAARINRKLKKCHGLSLICASVDVKWSSLIEMEWGLPGRVATLPRLLDRTF